MGIERKNRQAPAGTADPQAAPAPPPIAESEARQEGRQLILKFNGTSDPRLDRIECRWSQASRPSLWQQGDPTGANPMSWTKVPQALALIFLDYLWAAGRGAPEPAFLCEANGGDLVGALGNAISDADSRLHELFIEWLPQSAPTARVKQVFAGKNVHGKSGGERRICINPEFLPPDCVDLYWRASGSGRITDCATLRDLADRIRKHLDIPVEQPPPEEEGTRTPAPEPAAASATSPSKRDPLPTSATELFRPPPPVEKKKMPPPPQEPPAPESGSAPIEASKLSKWLADEFCQTFKIVRDQLAASSPAEKQPQQPSQPAPKAGSIETLTDLDAECDAPEESEDLAPEPLPPRIDPRLFEIQNPDRLEWLDSDGLLNFGGDDSEADVWRIRDANEGLLILGSVGSGKTSGSGSAVARAFLQAGFGGLVLIAKPDEARRWLRMCQETGREEDCIHVTPSSGHKLNFLQYESQRPGDRLAVTEDLIGLFRCLIGVMSHSKRSETRDDFWTNTTNQLMRKLIDIFLLAGEPLSVGRMVRFINSAPGNAASDWRTIKGFADVLTRARDGAVEGTNEDKRIFQESFEYWTQTYPRVAEVTRSGFVTAFSAMADTLSGRGIHEMIATETNLTPEMILSGKVVILDIPLKGNVQGGLMVQAMWKLLFQQAVERRADKGLNIARPAFLWEDEGHEFFSQHDVRFQPSARDCRVPHVILSQNIHNFLHLGHNQHAVLAVFAAMNTYIFHTNGDLDTNRWASERIGSEKKLKLTTDGLLKTVRPKDITLFGRRPEEVENVGRLQITEEKKQSMRPEDFAKLKRGGDGTCEAAILWLSHQFAANQNKNFRVLTFEQEERTT